MLLSIAGIPLKSNPADLISRRALGENYHHGLRCILSKILANQTISIAPTTNMLLIQKASVMLVTRAYWDVFRYKRFYQAQHCL